MTEQAERDPRVDPRAGDVLHVKAFDSWALTVDAVVGRNVMFTSKRLGGLGGAGPSRIYDIEYWREVIGNLGVAEIVTMASEATE